MSRWLNFIAGFSFIVLACDSAAWSRAEIFSGSSLEQAKQHAQKDGKLFLIDFTASWCPPCKKMESTTWADAAVQAWMKENAVAIQIDVDKDEKISAKYKITGMPTLVLFTPQSGDKEFGRQDGYLSSSELMQWLKGARSGKTSAELQKDADTGAAVWERMSKARELQTSGKDAEAFEEYLWLWNNINKDDPDTGQLKYSLLPSELKKLCATVAPAKTKLTSMRDAADKANQRQDWIILNGILDDHQLTLAWFDKAKMDPAQRPSLIADAKFYEPLLFGKCRWDDAATYLYADPMARIKEYYKDAEDMKRPRPDTEFAKDFDPFPSMVLMLYGAYVGAGREAEAKKIADECIRLDDTEGMREALNNMANAMRQARAAQGSASNTNASKSIAPPTKPNASKPVSVTGVQKK